LVFSVTETRPRWFAFAFFSIFSWRMVWLRAHLAHLLFARRRSGDGFKTDVAAPTITMPESHDKKTARMPSN
jgi:hypothetical protein